MHLSQIWRYPVKSMIGATVPTAELRQLGLVGDRTWAIWDNEAGRVGNARQTPGIMQFAAVHAPGGGVLITMPDGTTVASDDSAANDTLSTALGRPVSLVALRPADDLDFYRRPPFVSDDPMAHLREIFGRTEDEPLPDFSKFSAEVMEYETPPGTFYDVSPLLIMTTSALRSIADAVPESVVDVRRFRPSLVVDTGDEPGHPEFGWVGKQFAIGGAVVEVLNDCPRCVAITKEISAAIPPDRAILRHVVRELGQAVGVYCNVVQPGTVREGDQFVPA